MRRLSPRSASPKDARRRTPASYGQASPLIWKTMMHIVYVLRIIKNPDRHYVGYTTDLDSRVVTHNRGEVFHTAKWKPWKVVVAIHFPTQDRALGFDRYLKSGLEGRFPNVTFHRM